MIFQDNASESRISRNGLMTPNNPANSRTQAESDLAKTLGELPEGVLSSLRSLKPEFLAELSQLREETLDRLLNLPTEMLAQMEDLKAPALQWLVEAGDALRGIRLDWLPLLAKGGSLSLLGEVSPQALTVLSELPTSVVSALATLPQEFLKDLPITFGTGSATVAEIPVGGQTTSEDAASMLNSEVLATLAEMPSDSLATIAQLNPESIATLSEVPPELIATMAELPPEAVQTLTEIPQADIATLASVAPSVLPKMAKGMKQAPLAPRTLFVKISALGTGGGPLLGRMLSEARPLKEIIKKEADSSAGDSRQTLPEIEPVAPQAEKKASSNQANIEDDDSRDADQTMQSDDWSAEGLSAFDQEDSADVRNIRQKSATESADFSHVINPEGVSDDDSVVEGSSVDLNAEGGSEDAGRTMLSEEYADPRSTQAAGAAAHTDVSDDDESYGATVQSDDGSFAQTMLSDEGGTDASSGDDDESNSATIQSDELSGVPTSKGSEDDDSYGATVQSDDGSFVSSDDDASYGATIQSDEFAPRGESSRDDDDDSYGATMQSDEHFTADGLSAFDERSDDSGSSAERRIPRRTTQAPEDFSEDDNSKTMLSEDSLPETRDAPGRKDAAATSDDDASYDQTVQTEDFGDISRPDSAPVTYNDDSFAQTMQSSDLPGDVQRTMASAWGSFDADAGAGDAGMTIKSAEIPPKRKPGVPPPKASTVKGSEKETLVITTRKLGTKNVPEFNKEAKLPEYKDPEYDLVKVLGEGGMGIVFEARQRSIDREVALKMLKAKTAKDKEQRAKFLTEAVVTGELDHPNIVPIYDVGASADNALFYAMKKVQGTPWLKVVKEKSTTENLEILLRCADAVAFAHARGVIHRDLKPENVMLGAFGEVLVMDWGLAYSTKDFRKSKSITENTSMGGTPAYMAPEMATGPITKVGAHSDVYLFGAMLYEIITGKPPHAGKNAMKCLMAAARNEIRDPDPERTQKNDPTGELLAIAMKAMATDPKDRQPTIQAFQAELRDYQSHTESVTLSARALDDLDAAKKSLDYQQFARAVFGFEEAFLMWSGNHRAKDGAVEAKFSYAQCAQAKGDLDLGMSLLDVKIPAHKKLYDEMKSEVDAREARKAALARAKKIGIAAAIVFMAVISGAAVWIDAERREADAQRVIAEANEKKAKESAEEAQRQEGIAKEQTKIAKEQTKIAQANFEEATRQEKIAKANADEAKRQEGLAKESEKKAVASAEEARKQEMLAKANEKKATENAEEAKRQQVLAEKNAAEAKKQAMIADANAKEAKKQEMLALANLDEAKKQRMLAETNEKKANENADEAKKNAAEAKKQQLLAEKNEADAKKNAEEARKQEKLAKENEAEAKKQEMLAKTNEKKAKESAEEALKQKGIADMQRLVAEKNEAEAKKQRLIADEKRIEAELAKEAEEYQSYIARIGLADAKIRENAFAAAQDILSSCPEKLRNWEWGRLMHLCTRSAGSFDNGAPVDAIALAPSGNSFVTGGWSGEAVVWDSVSGAAKQRLKHDGLYVHAVDWSKDGKWIATGSNDPINGFVQLWNVETCERVNRAFGDEKTAHQDAVLSVQFSKDGSKLLTAGYDGSARLWDVAKGTLLKTYKGHTWWVWDAKFSPKEDKLVTASQDGKAILWETDTAKPSTPFTGHDGPIYSAAFSPDGVLIATGGYDRRILIWNPNDVRPYDFKKLELKDGNVIQPSKYKALDGHSGPVRSVEFSRDGLQLISGSTDNTVKLWSTDAGQIVKSFRGHDGAVRAAVFAEADQVVLSASADNHIKKWNIGQYEEVRVLQGVVMEGHQDAILAAGFSPDGKQVVTASRDQTARTWDAKTGRTLKVFTEGHSFLASNALYSPDGKWLMTAAVDNTVRIWDADAGTQFAMLEHTGRAAAMAISNDGKWLLTGADDKTAKLWDIKTGKLAFALPVHRNEVTAVAFSADSKLGVTGDAKGRVAIWDLPTKKLLKELNGHAKLRITGAIFVDDKRLLTSSADNTVAQWNMQTGLEERGLILKHPDGVAGMQLRAGTRQLVTACLDKKARVWDLDTAKEVAVLDGLKSLNSVAVDEQGEWALAADSEARKIAMWKLTQTGTVKPDRVVDMKTSLWSAIFAPSRMGQKLLTLGGTDARLVRAETGDVQATYSPAGVVASANFSPKGDRIVTGSWDSSARIWNAATGADELKLAGDDGHTAFVNSAVFSPDIEGQWVLTSSDDGTAKLWDSKTGKVVKTLAGHADRVRHAAFSKNGKQIVTSSSDKTAIIWDVATSKPLVTLKGHEWSVLFAQFNSEGTQVITASEDNTARIWNVADGNEVAKLAGHTARVTAASFAPTGNRAVTASQDGSVKLWDTKEVKEILTLDGHTREVTSVTFSPDGRSVLTGSQDGRAILWLAVEWDKKVAVNP